MYDIKSAKKFCGIHLYKIAEIPAANARISLVLGVISFANACTWKLLLPTRAFSLYTWAFDLSIGRVGACAMHVSNYEPALVGNNERPAKRRGAGRVNNAASD